MIAGARGIARAAEVYAELGVVSRRDPVAPIRAPWDAPHLFFTVREPFPSRTTRTDLVFGQISSEATLEVESLMPERGVIFSDGLENDFLEFNAGARARISVADRQGRLVA